MTDPGGRPRRLNAIPVNDDAPRREPARRIGDVELAQLTGNAAAEREVATGRDDRRQRCVVASISAASFPSVTDRSRAATQRGATAAASAARRIGRRSTVRQATTAVGPDQ